MHGGRLAACGGGAVVFIFAACCCFPVPVEPVPHGKETTPAAKTVPRAAGATAAPGPHDPTPEQLDTLVEYALANRERWIRTYNLKRAGLARVGMPAENKQQEAKEIDRILAGLKSGEIVPIPDFPYPADDGDIGQFVGQFQVVQQLDGRSTIGVWQYLGDEQTILLRGKDLRGRDTFDVVAFQSLVRCVGQQEYTSVLGTQRRVPIIEPVRLEPVIEVVRARLFPKKLPVPKPAPAR